MCYPGTARMVATPGLEPGAARLSSASSTIEVCGDSSGQNLSSMVLFFLP